MINNQTFRPRRGFAFGRHFSLRIFFGPWLGDKSHGIAGVFTRFSLISLIFLFE